MELRDAVIEALKKKAIGYQSREIAEEYNVVDGEETLIKRKVSIKENPPDVSALKMLLELSPPDEGASMSEDEVKREKLRLIKLLMEEENGTDKGKGTVKVRNRLVQEQGESHA